ncbi:uncharacterized protein MONOS_9036 [Monocercomonoides exilis]|uniref:uncharacterized protein n=1 Tax=Monocercomonoides exilis TaxID=2049356 RepID=UPI003559C1E1|nr:hypothetical protein MONOS_9036 [Monocercomonoides exilis]|eukprot:MONOS_9036.1-p1 / transcript=MONOS_9036.1 / gene=MONOS_9036 / organism=Monocercomonoides_exilis_PA203 / gene_product=unspecified product / transcript_product=unspecified product / location=Mono_scaffold00359:24217-25151(-) / protein_length=157 / sequence_SO=supercontig / SO=protein_coding / is_pseudo=false
MWGCAAQNYCDEEDLLELIVVYQSETIFASSSADNASDSRQCGDITAPCSSLNVALSHIIPSVYSNLLINKSAVASWEASACDVFPLQAEEFAGETDIHTAIPASIVTTASEVTEVSVKILFGRVESPASTDSFILKNRSEVEPKGDERNVEGGKE